MTGALADRIAAGESAGDLGFVMSAETAPHAACWMSWVHDDEPWSGRAA